MKKTIIPILALLLLAGTSYAQFTLYGGPAPFYQLVKQPYFHYDLMRYQQNSWVRQYRENTSQPWSNSNLLINRKDANGDFTYLEYSIWNSGSMSWEVYSKFVFDRLVNGPQLAEEVKLEWTRDEEDNLLQFNSRSDITWENGRLKQVSRVTSNENGQSNFSNTYFRYDANNRRVHDSEAVNDMIFWENKYAYNSFGQCTANYLLIGNDTVVLTAYDYTDSLLTRYSSYNHQDAPVLQYQELYEYDAKGRITKATIAGPGTDSVIYKHGYNNDDLLLWMCSYSYEEGQWNKSDSVALTYTGTHADTSYGYVSANQQTWNAWPSFRFLFDDARVGVKETTQVLDFKVYPNPANNKITINTRAGALVNHLTISDLTGKKIMEQTQLQSGELDVSGISPGIYFLHVQSNGQSGIKKIIIN